MILLAVLVVAACDDGDTGKKATTTTVGASTTTAPSAAPVTLHAYNVELVYDCDTCENPGLRVGVDSTDTTIGVAVTGWTDTDLFALYACPVPDLGADSPAGPPEDDCTELTPGAETAIAHPAGNDGIEITLAPSRSFTDAADPPDTVTIEQAAVTYAATTNRSMIQLPLVSAPVGASACKDNACNPYFEMTPFTLGSIDARASWGAGTPAPSTLGRLQILVGEVSAHRMSETGIAYGVPATSDGPSPRYVVGRVPASEAAVALQDLDPTRPLQEIELTITWP